MADTTNLQAAIDALTAQVEKTKGTEQSAIQLISGFAAKVTDAVTAALTADNAADQGSIDAAVAAISTVSSQFQASADDLGAAVAANA